MKRELVKAHYAQTLMDLCKEGHALGDLKVADVIAASGMSRPTFYHHFANLPELTSFTVSRSYLGTKTALFTAENIRLAYRYAADHRPFFAQLSPQGELANLRRTTHQWLRKKGYELYLPPLFPHHERLQRMVQFDMFLSGSLDVMETWFSTGMNISPDEIAAAVAIGMPAFMTEPGAPVAPPVSLDDYPK